MARLIRNTAILAKIETTYGTDAVPTGAANALLISNMSVDITANNIDRDLIRGYLGASEQLVGTRRVEIGFDLEIAGSGDAGLTAPAWGPVLKAAGFAETDAGAYFEYTPISTAFPSLTIYYYLDGVVYKALGCRGSIDFKLTLDSRPVMSCKFTGIDGGASAAANPSQTLTAWKTPVGITTPNTADINLGCTYSLGALSGGTNYPSRGLELSLGNDVQHTPLLGGESVDIVNRSMTGKIEIELDAASEVAMLSAINANTLTTLGFEVGTTAGNKVLFYAPAVQRINPKIVDVNGRALLGMDLRVTPSAGNDEIKIVAK